MTCSIHESAGKRGCSNCHLNDDIKLRLFRSPTGLDSIIQCTSEEIFLVYDAERINIYILYRI